MTTYGQFCPVAKAMEVLDERWTLLVVRELLAGSTRFNELRRGNPKMSPALLAKRLRSLERAGVVRRHETDGHAGYRLTQAGEELRPLVEGLGAWGTRWVGGLGEADLDPHLLMWDMRRTVPVAAWPRESAPSSRSGSTACRPPWRAGGSWCGTARSTSATTTRVSSRR
jgi:DNA-binding HxlR family transcriptional regulator